GRLRRSPSRCLVFPWPRRSALRSAANGAWRRGVWLDPLQFPPRGSDGPPVEPLSKWSQHPPWVGEETRERNPLVSRLFETLTLSPRFPRRNQPGSKQGRDFEPPRRPSRFRSSDRVTDRQRVSHRPPSAIQFSPNCRRTA